MESGASSYVDKSAPLSELITAIKTSSTSPLTFTARKITDAISLKNQSVGLTARELEILEILPTGDTVTQMAQHLFVTESTI